jgi:hypothetical protein
MYFAFLSFTYIPTSLPASNKRVMTYVSWKSGLHSRISEHSFSSFRNVNTSITWQLIVYSISLPLGLLTVSSYAFLPKQRSNGWRCHINGTLKYKYHSMHTVYTKRGLWCMKRVWVWSAAKKPSIIREDDKRGSFFVQKKERWTTKTGHG